MRFPLHRVAVAVVVLAAVATYAWTTATSVEVTRAAPQYEPYPRLANAFLHGRLSLDVRVPPGLLRLRDPYDPDQNAPYRNCCGFKPDSLHDLSLHDGRVYPYWGPVPAAVFMPFELFGVHLEQGWAVFGFTVAAFLLSVAVLFELLRLAALRRRRRWMEVVAVATLAWSGVMLFNLRRPAQYEVALASGLCFVMLGLLLVLRATTSERRNRLLIGASAAFALAFGCRPTFGLAEVLVLVPLLQDVHAGDWRARGREIARRWTVFVPFAVALLLSAAYNLARFGSPTEFGLHDLLAGVDLDKHPLAQAGYLPPALWYYVLAPPLLRLHFPFVFLPPPPAFWGPTPSTYFQSELVGGVAVCVPIVLLALLLPRVRPRVPLRRMLVALVVLGGVLLVFDAFYVYTAVMRYEADFLGLFLLAALTTWIVVGNGSALVRRGGAALAVVGIVVGLAISIRGEGSSLERSRPGTFESLNDLFSPIPTVAASVAGHPLITAVSGRAVVEPRYDRLAISQASFRVGDTPVTLEVASPSTRTATLTGTLTRGPALDPDYSAAMQITSGKRVVAEIPLDRSVTAGKPFSIPVSIGNGLNDLTFTLVAHPRPDTSQVGDDLSDLRDVRVR